MEPQEPAWDRLRLATTREGTPMGACAASAIPVRKAIKKGGCYIGRSGGFHRAKLFADRQSFFLTVSLQTRVLVSGFDTL